MFPVRLHFVFELLLVDLCAKNDTSRLSSSGVKAVRHLGVGGVGDVDRVDLGFFLNERIRRSKLLRCKLYRVIQDDHVCRADQGHLSGC